MLQSCWQISSKVILLPIHYVICIFINKQVDIYSLAKLQLHNKKSIVNVIGESYFPTEKGEYTDESDWGGNNDNPIEEDDEIEPIENLCFAQTIQDEYWEILINEEFDPKLLNLYKIEVTNDSENPFVYSSGIVKYNHDLYSIKQLDWLEYHKLVDSKIK